MKSIPPDDSVYRLMEEEEARTRAAYQAQPDSEQEADDWSTAEEWRR